MLLKLAVSVEQFQSTCKLASRTVDLLKCVTLRIIYILVVQHYDLYLYHSYSVVERGGFFDRCVCLLLCQHDNLRMIKHRMIKIVDKCTEQRSRPSANYIGPIFGCPDSQNVANRTFRTT